VEAVSKGLKMCKEARLGRARESGRETLTHCCPKSKRSLTPLLESDCAFPAGCAIGPNTAILQKKMAHRCPIPSQQCKSEHVVTVARTNDKPVGPQLHHPAFSMSVLASLQVVDIRPIAHLRRKLSGMPVATQNMRGVSVRHSPSCSG
jgi:hypothetical protein